MMICETYTVTKKIFIFTYIIEGTFKYDERSKQQKNPIVPGY